MKILDASRLTGVGIIRYHSDESLARFIEDIKATRSYCLKSAVHVAGLLYTHAMQHKDFTHFIEDSFQDILVNEHGLIITDWQEIASHTATCDELIHAFIRMSDQGLPVLLTIPAHSPYIFSSHFQSSTFEID